MSYEIIENGQVLKNEERVREGKPNGIIKTPFCMNRRLMVTSSVTQTVVNTPLIIDFKCQTVSINEAGELEYADNSEVVDVTAKVGESGVSVPTVAGIGDFEFSSETTGTYKIALSAVGYDSAEVEVVVNAA